MIEKTYVKTVYGQNSHRDPDITSYETKEEAESFVSTCLKWGVDIISCEICTKPAEI